MSIRQSTFPSVVWDGLAPSLANRDQDKLADAPIADQHSAEILAIENYIKTYVDLLRLIGNANTIIGVNNAGTALEFKALIAGSNITIGHSAGAITFTASGSESPYTGEADSDVVIGQPVYVKANSHVDLAKADDAATMKVAGLVSSDTLTTFSAPYVSDGRIIQADWTAITGSVALTPGAVYYLDTMTAGKLTITAPTASGFVIAVGRAINTTTFDIEISNPIKL